MLEVEVTAPEVGVTALDSSSRLCLSDYAENLNLQPADGESPLRPLGRVVVVALLFFVSFLFLFLWNQGLHAHGHVDPAECCGFFQIVQSQRIGGVMHPGQQNPVQGRGLSQLTFPGRVCRHSKEFCARESEVHLFQLHHCKASVHVDVACVWGAPV